MLGLLGDKKKMVSLILSEKQKPKETEVPQGLEADFSQAHESLAKEFIEGIKNDDPGMVSRSLKQFIQLCVKEDDYTQAGD